MRNFSQNVIIYVFSRSAGVAAISLDALLGGPLPGGEWRKVVVSFTSATRGDWIDIYLSGDVGGTQSKIYVDDVKLISATAGTCASGAAAGTSCADANVCDGAEVCDGAGHCLKGAWPEIDDQNPCTSDSCDPASGGVHAAAHRAKPRLWVWE